MGNRRLIITFALVFAAVFSLFYYAMFHMLDVEETAAAIQALLRPARP